MGFCSENRTNLSGGSQRETVMYTCQNMYPKASSEIASRITDAVSNRSTIGLYGTRTFTHRI
jgi:hypothetical protein